MLFVTLCAAFAAEEKNDIEFARPGGVPLTLDASIPDGKGPFATVVVVHGGGWQNGSKRSYEKPLLPVLTQAGFAWFTINYRLAPQHKYPAAVEDVEAAVRWVKQHAKEYKVDDGIALMANRRRPLGGDGWHEAGQGREWRRWWISMARMTW